jgi:hypothetical protein
MDKNRKAFEQWCLENGYFDEIEDSGTTTARFDDNMFIAWKAATAAAESERNNLLAVIAEKDAALQEVINVLEATDHPGISDTVWVVGNSPETLYECVSHAKSISPDNCKLVSFNPADCCSYDNILEVIEYHGDTAFTLSTINDTISGRDGE